MKPSAFEYHVPGTIEETVALLREHGDEARLLAGGQSLVPLMNLRMAAPEVLIDLNRVTALASIHEEDGALVLGAMTRYADVEESDLVAARLPVLALATHEVGYAAIRSRGTVGGSVAHADPVGEWPMLAVAFGAELVATGPAGRRTIPAEAFFQGIFATALRADEVLTELRFPLPGGWRLRAFDEFAPQVGDYAVVAVGLDLGVDDGSVITDARIAYSNLADRPIRSPGAEAALTGLSVEAEPEPDLARTLSAALRTELSTESEALAERIELAGVVARRALGRAIASARGARRERP